MGWAAKIREALRWEPRPSKRVARTVTHTLKRLGFSDEYLAEDMAREIGSEVANRQAERQLKRDERVQGLLEANNQEVERRRTAERVIGQIQSFVRSQDRCNPGDPYEPGLKVIFQSLGYSPT